MSLNGKEGPRGLVVTQGLDPTQVNLIEEVVQETEATLRIYSSAREALTKLHSDSDQFVIAPQKEAKPRRGQITNLRLLTKASELGLPIATLTPYETGKITTHYGLNGTDVYIPLRSPGHVERILDRWFTMAQDKDFRLERPQA